MASVGQTGVHIPHPLQFEGFTFATFWIVINRDYYGIDISLNTYLLIIFSLVCWGVGDLLANLHYSKYKI